MATNLDLQLTPSRTLHFSVPAESQEVTENLSVQNKTDVSVAFKFKSTAPSRYQAKPSMAILNPGAKLDLHVTVRLFRDPPTAATTFDQNGDLQDRFLIESFRITKDMQQLNSQTLKEKFADKNVQTEKQKMYSAVTLQYKKAAQPTGSRPPAPIPEPQTAPPLNLGSTQLFQSVLETSERPKESENFMSPREDPEPTPAPASTPEPAKAPSPVPSGPSSLQNSADNNPAPKPTQDVEAPKQPEPTPAPTPAPQPPKETQPEPPKPAPADRLSFSGSDSGSSSAPTPVPTEPAPSAEVKNENKGKEPLPPVAEPQIATPAAPTPSQQPAPVESHQLPPPSPQPTPVVAAPAPTPTPAPTPSVLPNAVKGVTPQKSAQAGGQVSITEINLMLLLLAFVAGYVSSWLFKI